MTPDSMANEVEEQKLLLKQYLGQYYYAKMKKKQLEARLRTFRVSRRTSPREIRFFK